MQNLGVRDSKKLTDEKIIQIAPELIKNIPHTTIILSNKEYNDYHSTDVNMNKIKAILHNKCLLSVIKKDNINYSKIVIDQFEPPKSYYAHLSQIPEKVTNITFITQAEDKCMSVAASSIISRYIFLNEMEKLSKSINKILPLGASTVVDEAGKDIVNKEKIDYVLDKCDGFIVPGGTYFYHFDEYVIDYAIRNDKPLLCICLGFQALCSMFAKDRTKFDMTIEDSTNSHKGEPDKYFHDVVVSNKLKDIFGTDRLMVNSVHHDLVKFEMNELVINAKCGDVIEGVEYPNKKFIIGVQWHPEYLMDDNSKKLLNEFIKNTK